MLLDLIRSLLVTVLTIAMPGFFWARVLFPALDWVERSVLTTALSLTLVPTTAGFLATFFGPGITLPVATASIIVVTLAGVIAYLCLGQAGPIDTYIGLHQSRLHGPALATLTLASALMIATGVGLLPAKATTGFIALMIVATAVLHIVERRRRSPIRRAGSRADDSKPHSTWEPEEKDGAMEGQPPKPTLVQRLPALLTSHKTLLGGVLLLVLVRGYSGVVLHDWPYIRGQDVYAHAAMVELVLTRGTAQSFLVYPPGFHVLVAVLTRLSGLGPLDLFPTLAPALLLLPTLACYVLANRLFGPDYGLASAFFAGAVLNSAYLFVYDGTYVDLIGAHFLLVLAVVALVMLLDTPSVRNIVLLAVLGSSVVLYHSVATIYLALLLATVSVVFLPYLLLRDRRRGVALLASLVLLTTVSLYYAWDTYQVPQTVGALLNGTGATDTTNHAAMAIGTQRPRRSVTYLHHISAPVGWFGLLGVLLLVPALRRLRPDRWPALALLLGWCLLFFVASRTSLSAFPIRFTRDLGVPLAVTAAYAFVTILRSWDRYRPATIIAVCMVSLAVLLQVQQGLSQGSAPSIVQFMTPDIEAGGAWLRAHNKGGNIIVSPHRNQVTGNAMLAMGGYAELPTYTEGQLRAARQIPPRDRQAVMDALWVLKHPGSRKTSQQILKQYDIRYVVLYKRLREGSYWYGQNPINWRPFLRRPELYKRAFENHDVVIFKVRKRE